MHGVEDKQNKNYENPHDALKSIALWKTEDLKLMD
jgi:hypothetical protein